MSLLLENSKVKAERVDYVSRLDPIDRSNCDMNFSGMLAVALAGDIEAAPQDIVACHLLVLALLHTQILFVLLLPIPYFIFIAT